MFCWKTQGSGIHVDVALTCKTYVKIIADHIHPFRVIVFPDGSRLIQHDNAAYYTAKTEQNGFRNGLRIMMNNSRCYLGLQIPQTDWATMGFAGQTNLIDRDPTS